MIAGLAHSQRDWDDCRPAALKVTKAPIRGSVVRGFIRVQQDMAFRQCAAGNRRAEQLDWKRERYDALIQVLVDPRGSAAMALKKVERLDRPEALFFR